MLRNHLIAASLLMAATTSLAWAGEAGRVILTNGQVQIAGKAAVRDAVVNEGDELSTGADGYVYVKTVDDGFLILRPNSKARVTAYTIDKANPSNTKVKLELLNGVARAISGQGVKNARQNFRFNTPVAAIGVRGTDFTVYTDQLTSRVSVMSGGVVMSALGGNCTAEGLGPCEGPASRELFAGQAGMLLQVQRGQQAPQLLNNPSLVPDQTEKPRPDEPTGKVSTGGTTLSVAPVNLDPQRTQASLAAVRPAVDDKSQPTNPPIVTTPPVVETVQPPVVLPPKPQEVFWGRWSSVAGAAVMPDAIAEQKTDDPAFVDKYAVARVKGATLVMPREGTVAYNLTNSEAFIQKADSQEIKGIVDSGKLDVNFANRSFTTSLAISGDGSQYNVSGRGVIDMKGQMMNDMGTNTAIRGFLSGSNVEEAAYVFKNTSNPGTTISGATSWKR
ncbi:FecR domain-containing protein [Pseudoduganella sp.]|uniref:FecR domain-containing protein n=1 Tax=Pseudoduganella sp. TaxID=1880898 RepID=UPI0035AF46E8